MHPHLVLTDNLRILRPPGTRKSKHFATESTDHARACYGFFFIFASEMTDQSVGFVNKRFSNKSTITVY